MDYQGKRVNPDIADRGLIPKVIPLKLFLDIVPSSSVDVTRALRGCFRGGFLYVSFCFKAKEDLQRCDVFSYILISKQQRSFLRPSLCFNTFRNFNRSLNKRQMSTEQTITTE